MPAETPAELVTKILAIVSRQDWRNEQSALQELRNYVLGDPLDLQFEFFGIAPGSSADGESVGAGNAEVIVRTGSLPYKAVLALDPRGAWKLKEFLTQCTGCLGTGLIVDRQCNSCGGTGWGLRPS